MGDKIDMSLDDIIKSNKKPGGRGRGGRGRPSRGRGTPRRQNRGGGVFRGGVQKRRSGGGENRSFNKVFMHKRHF